MKSITKISLFIIIIASYQTAYCSETTSRLISAAALHANLESETSLTHEPSSSVTADESVFYEVSSEALFDGSTESSPFDPLNPNHIQQKFFGTPIHHANDDLEVVIDQKMINQQLQDLTYNCYIFGVKKMNSTFVDESDNTVYCKFELSNTPFKDEEEAATPILQSADKKNSAYFTATNGLISATIVASAVTGYWLMRKK